MHIIPYIIAIIICELVGILGAVFTVRAIPSWYEKLRKPSFRPPNWLFGPVWTLLYLLMGIASARVWNLRIENEAALPALVAFLSQLALNGIWTPIFFGWKKLGLAAIEIILLWISIVLTVAAFWLVDHASAWLLVPYLAWVSFASVLNIAIWLLNRQRHSGGMPQ